MNLILQGTYSLIPCQLSSSILDRVYMRIWPKTLPPSSHFLAPTPLTSFKVQRTFPFPGFAISYRLNWKVSRRVVINWTSINSHFRANMYNTYFLHHTHTHARFKSFCLHYLCRRLNNTLMQLLRPTGCNDSLSK